MENRYPVARYRFVFAVQTPIRQPDYAGSMLRGAFGHALRRTACMTGEKDCKACPLYRSCPYPAIFETPAPENHALQKFSQIPNPYVIEPPQWGERTYAAGEKFTFHMVLTGAALNQLALIVFAWQRAFSHGVGRGTAQLVDVMHCTPDGDVSIWDGQRLQAHTAQISLPRAEPSDLQLTLTTPLRLQEQGKPLRPSRIQPADLLVAAMRRISLLQELHMARQPDWDFAEHAQAAQAIKGNADLHWLDWSRYSCRQQQEMMLGGVAGHWVLHAVPAAFVEWLYLGQWLHLGKGATMGMGQYRIDAPIS